MTELRSITRDLLILFASAVENRIRNLLIRLEADKEAEQQVSTGSKQPTKPEEPLDDDALDLLQPRSYGPPADWLEKVRRYAPELLRGGPYMETPPASDVQTEAGAPPGDREEITQPRSSGPPADWLEKVGRHAPELLRNSPYTVDESAATDADTSDAEIQSGEEPGQKMPEELVSIHDNQGLEATSSQISSNVTSGSSPASRGPGSAERPLATEKPRLLQRDAVAPQQQAASLSSRVKLTSDKRPETLTESSFPPDKTHGPEINNVDHAMRNRLEAGVAEREAQHDNGSNAGTAQRVKISVQDYYPSHTEATNQTMTEQQPGAMLSDAPISERVRIDAHAPDMAKTKTSESIGDFAVDSSNLLQTNGIGIMSDEPDMPQRFPDISATDGQADNQAPTVTKHRVSKHTHEKQSRVMQAPRNIGSEAAVGKPRTFRKTIKSGLGERYVKPDHAMLSAGFDAPAPGKKTAVETEGRAVKKAATVGNTREENSPRYRDTNGNILGQQAKSQSHPRRMDSVDTLHSNDAVNTAEPVEIYESNQKNRDLGRVMDDVPADAGVFSTSDRWPTLSDEFWGEPSEDIIETNAQLISSLQNDNERLHRLEIEHKGGAWNMWRF